MNIGLHKLRMNASRKELFDEKDPLSIESILAPKTKNLQGIYKCRIIYNQSIQSIELEPYLPRPIHTLKIIHCDEILYDYKFEDRKSIEKLFSEKGLADDIIIVKNGFITDSSICNIVAYDGTRWVTPAKPLLKGIMRQFLLNKKMIFESDISLPNFLSMKKFRLINAMKPFDEAPDLLMDAVHI